MGHRTPVKFPALKIHARVHPGRVGGKYSLEDDQRLQQFFPRRFGYIAQTGDQLANLLRRIRVVQRFLATRREFFQQYQL